MTLTIDIALRERPTFLARLARLNWVLVALLCALGAVGYAMLVSVADGDPDRWARGHIYKFTLGMVAMFAVSLIDIRVWRQLAPAIYLVCLAALAALTLFDGGNGQAARWIEIGSLRLQPSEPMKVAVVLAMAALYASGPQPATDRWWRHAAALALVVFPVALVFQQPDLGTALLIALGGLTVVFLAGIPTAFVVAGCTLAVLAVAAVRLSRGTAWQLLADYQYRRIDTFLDPTLDPSGAGYHLLQSQVAFGAGGMWGAGYMKGSQSNLDFLPEKHTDFIYAALAEEFGFSGSLLILGLHLAVLLVAAWMMLRAQGRFARLLVGGMTTVFALYFLVNMCMVVGLLPVVGVPLPLISHGGSAMLTVLVTFGLMQSAIASADRTT